MSDLVPEAAIVAAEETYYALYQEHTTDRLLATITAAAQFIAADALRWAASRARKEHAAKAFRLQTVTDYYPEPGITPTQLDQWADELEGNN